jgi:hypothetical protein
MKKCVKCKQSEPDVTFHPNRKNPDNQARHCTECNKTYLREYRARDRLLALQAYSPAGKPSCACPGCQEHHIEFLTIDHINGGVLYRWLKKNGYPPGFRVLCYNCNNARGAGECPVHASISSLETPQVVPITTTDDKDQERVFLTKLLKAIKSGRVSISSLEKAAARL